ncbi:MAG: NAD(P)/FAD-dependent oxidoreductase, partial [Chloroflexaceae bacterium]|nr:NAD(P)/FAD-dependent oxidoreductase [Chloroflexaceae bacterium]
MLGQQEVDVLLIDRNNYHGFWPLLYQVATAGLEPEAIAYPVRAIVRKFRNVGFQMGEVKHVDFQNRLVYVDNYSIPYDYLILAAGSANNYFGNNALAEHTYGLKDIDEAENLRNRVLSSFERAIVERDPQRRKQLLTLAVVGGGPTGVELAGAFVELIQHVLRHDYPQINVHDTKVVLIEATDKILAAFPEQLRRNALKRLQRMGVDVRLNTAVASVEKERVHFKDGTSLETNTVVWAAGVRAANLADTLGVAQARGARVKVKLSLNLAEYPNVFVVGDMAYLEGYQKPDQAYPMVAQVAIQQGKAAAHNILNHVRNRSLQPFRYFDFGSMATIGRRSAVFDAFGIRLTGVIAWLGWLFIHLMYLVGFRNRVIVLIN